jgi:Putative translation initiation inhibitor, yjgF family
MTRDAVTSDQLPASGLPFSVAVRGGGLLFLSGQVAQDPATGELVDGDIAQQADQILRNIAATLAAIGKDLDDVIRVGVYLTDMSQFGAMNEAYAGTSPSPTRPAPRSAWPPCRWARRSRWMWWWAEVSACGTRSSGTVIFAMRARHSGQKAAQN